MEKSSLQNAWDTMNAPGEVPSRGRSTSQSKLNRHSMFNHDLCLSLPSPSTIRTLCRGKRRCIVNNSFCPIPSYIRYWSRLYPIAIFVMFLFLVTAYFLLLYSGRNIVGSYFRYSRPDERRSRLLSRFSSSTSGSKKLSPELVSEITRSNHNLVYIHEADIVLVTLAQAGTKSLFQWLYRGTTGRLSWDRSGCSTFVQDVRSHCWTGYISNVYSLQPDQQLYVLTSPSVLRVAIQRDPFERLISAYKSKIACTTSNRTANSSILSSPSQNDYNTHNANYVYTNSQYNDSNSQPSTVNAGRYPQPHDNSVNPAYRNRLVSLLRRLAVMPPPSMALNSDADDLTNCMSISEFATILDRLRKFQGHPLFIRSISDIDVHLRPQNFYFDDINYDMILDIRDLSDTHVLQPIINRLPFGRVVNHSIPVLGGPKYRLVDIPFDAADKLRQYAELSVTAPPKYMPGYRPTVEH